MTVNFGTLSPIQAPSVVATLAPQQNNNPLAQLGQGLQGAVQAGQSAEMNSLNIQKGKMEIEGMEAQRRDAATLREAAGRSEADYIKALMQSAPDKAMAYYKVKEEIGNIHANTFKTDAEGQKLSLENQREYMVTFGQIAANADSLKGPDGQPMPGDVKQRYVQGAVALLPKQGQQFFETMTKTVGLDQNTSIAMQIIGQETMADQAEAAEKKAKPSATVQNAKKIARLKDVLTQNPNDINAQNQLASMEQQTAKPSTVANAWDTAAAKSGETTLTKISERKTAYKQTQQAADGALEALKKTPGMVLNPVANFFKAGNLSPDAQVLKSFMNTLTLIKKTEFSMGSQGFTDADREFVQAINGDLSTYKGSLETLLNNAKAFSSHAAQEDWMTEYNIQKKTSDGGKSFLADSPEPMVSVLCGDGVVRDVPVRQRDNLLKADTKAKVQ